ncbi:MAG: DUF2905 family protein [Candidatus Methylomirabilales bacterium]
MDALGRTILGFGVLLVLVGGLMMLFGRAGLPSLPGDLSFRRGNFRVFLPLGTSLLLSVLLTIVLNLLIRR